MADERSLRRALSLALAALVCGSAPQALALVGAAAPMDEAVGSQLVMVLARSGGGAGFCSGIVVAPRLVLTAAHCVGTASDTRVHLADPTSPALLPVTAVAVHPGYRADAVQSRQRSIDLALLQLATPLPSKYAAATLAPDAVADIGTRVDLAGFGLADERAPRTGGVLRRGTAHVQQPRSDILLWLNGPAYGCTGDSGGAVLDATTGAVVGVIAWAQGHGRACGALTQAIRLGPARAWVEEVQAGWLQ